MILSDGFMRSTQCHETLFSLLQKFCFVPFKDLLRAAHRWHSLKHKHSTSRAQYKVLKPKQTVEFCAAAGIVSSVNRQIRGAGNRIIRDVIQTDAAINPGNSGGPLLDSNGRLIGVNTMIFSPSGGNIGIGFAVPINTVRRVVAQLVSTGRVRRGRVGISLLGDEPSTHIRHALQLPTGVIVNSVEPDSGAAQAGIRYGPHVYHDIPR
jgi:S1-C subfamily serine protease